MLCMIPLLDQHQSRDADPETRKNKNTGDKVSHMCCSCSKTNGLWVWVSWIVLIKNEKVFAYVYKHFVKLYMYIYIYVYIYIYIYI